jgi:AbrB family looped-hinge helix DNA binding protein
MSTVKTLAKGQIVIPAEMRKKYHIDPGTEMQIMEYGGIIYLIPPVADPVKAAQGSLPSRPSLAGQLLRERRSDYK